jgi:DNA repair protein RecN (Recombination protein N)
MLTQLNIKDFAIIDSVDVTLGNGMTVLTGETGAGKSILLDALSMVLGDRADSGVIRHGAERADITAVFDIADSKPAARWLQEHELESEDECVLRRVINADGRSKSYINGRPVPLQSLRALCESLVDIHGQHEHQSLLKDAVQRELLDEFGALHALSGATANAYREWRDCAAQLQALQGAADNRDERLDLLRYQVSELRALDPRSDELQQLEEQHVKLSNADRLSTGLAELISELYETDTSVHDRLARLTSRAETLAAVDDDYARLSQLLESARINIDEAVSEARDQLAGCESDPARLAEIDKRLGAMHELARKHRIAPAELPAQLEKMASELDDLENAGSRIEEYRTNLDSALEAYRDVAGRLSAARRKAAKKLGRSVTEIMQTLGMQGGELMAVVDTDDGKPGPSGDDTVRLDVTANSGQPLRALRKVASGGELSRISLAVQLVATHAARIPTLIFDEIDAGIGGATADIVGQKLATLGAQYQTLCVTHLPQVAARADHHLQVSKISGDSLTRTRVRQLDGRERVNEIARMLGGVELTPQSLAHAEAMVSGNQR